MTALLDVKDLDAGYGEIQVLWNINLSVDKGSIVSVLGPNGAGKTTLTKVIMGVVKPYRGSVIFKGEDITNVPAYERIKLGLSIVPEGRQLFPQMSVLENLYMGMYHLKKIDVDALEFTFNLFPILKERLSQKAGTLSGGEQQMLAIARALVSRPQLLILDEPSQGLAPKIVQSIMDTLRRLREEYGISILLIEQYAHDALRISDYAYVLRSGRIVYSGSSDELARDKELISKYLS
ncbi:MAG: ABC transporter ATP-binding protein [Desulfurococcales archaeon]|nr:ABC transporter ATP-binding protein [Desulfurococcales archaeon]